MLIKLTKNDKLVVGPANSTPFIAFFNLLNAISRFLPTVITFAIMGSNPDMTKLCVTTPISRRVQLLAGGHFKCKIFPEVGVKCFLGFSA